jgi:hypothetical protein
MVAALGTVGSVRTRGKRKKHRTEVTEATEGIGVGCETFFWMPRLP